jgi:hypothetical protein
LLLHAATVPAGTFTRLQLGITSRPGHLLLHLVSLSLWLPAPWNPWPTTCSTHSPVFGLHALNPAHAKCRLTQPLVKLIAAKDGRAIPRRAWYKPFVLCVLLSPESPSPPTVTTVLPSGVKQPADTGPECPEKTCLNAQIFVRICVVVCRDSYLQTHSSQIYGRCMPCFQGASHVQLLAQAAKARKPKCCDAMWSKQIIVCECNILQR